MPRKTTTTALLVLVVGEGVRLALAVFEGEGLDGLADAGGRLDFLLGRIGLRVGGAAVMGEKQGGQPAGAGEQVDESSHGATSLGVNERARSVPPLYQRGRPLVSGDAARRLLVRSAGRVCDGPAGRVALVVPEGLLVAVVWRERTRGRVFAEVALAGERAEKKIEPPAIPSLPAAHEVLSFSPKQRTPVS